MAGCRKEWKRGREERSREGWKDVGKNGNGKGRKGAGKDGRMRERSETGEGRKGAGKIKGCREERKRRIKELRRTDRRMKERTARSGAEKLKDVGKKGNGSGEGGKEQERWKDGKRK